MKKNPQAQPCNKPLDLGTKNTYNNNVPKSEELMCVDEMKVAMEMAASQKNQAKIILPLAKAFTSALEKHGKNTEEKIKKQSEYCMQKWAEVKKSNEDLRSEMLQFKAESMADRQSLREHLVRLETTITKSLERASKWKALTDMLTACFGTMKDTIKTILIIGFFTGAVHFNDIKELVKLALQ